MVLETRKQIESRNPQAFAPKVIRSTDSVLDTWGENNKTPASARHKRGCNCRKSSCLKKLVLDALPVVDVKVVKIVLVGRMDVMNLDLMGRA